MTTEEYNNQKVTLTIGQLRKMAIEAYNGSMKMQGKLQLSPQELEDLEKAGNEILKNMGIIK